MAYLNKFFAKTTVYADANNILPQNTSLNLTGPNCGQKVQKCAELGSAHGWQLSQRQSKQDANMATNVQIVGNYTVETIQDFSSKFVKFVDFNDHK